MFINVLIKTEYLQYFLCAQYFPQHSFKVLSIRAKMADGDEKQSKGINVVCTVHHFAMCR